MDPAAEAAISTGNDAFAADGVGKTQDALRDEFRMLDHIGRMADDSG